MSCATPSTLPHPTKTPKIFIDVVQLDVPLSKANTKSQTLPVVDDIKRLEIILCHFADGENPTYPFPWTTSSFAFRRPGKMLVRLTTDGITCYHKNDEPLCMI